MITVTEIKKYLITSKDNLRNPREPILIGNNTTTAAMISQVHNLVLKYCSKSTRARSAQTPTQTSRPTTSRPTGSSTPSSPTTNSQRPCHPLLPWSPSSSVTASTSRISMARGPRRTPGTTKCGISTPTPKSRGRGLSP